MQPLVVVPGGSLFRRDAVGLSYILLGLALECPRACRRLPSLGSVALSRLDLCFGSCAPCSQSRNKRAPSAARRAATHLLANSDSRENEGTTGRRKTRTTKEQEHSTRPFISPRSSSSTALVNNRRPFSFSPPPATRVSPTAGLTVSALQ